MVTLERAAPVGESPGCLCTQESVSCLVSLNEKNLDEMQLGGVVGG